MEKILEGLGINPAVLFSQVVAFLLLFWILSKYFFKRIAQTISARESDIHLTYKKLQQEKEEIEIQKREYARKMEEIEKEKLQILNQAIAEAKQVAEKLKQEAHQEIAQMRRSHLQKIAYEREAVIKQARQEIIELSLAIAEKFIKEKITPEVDSELIEKFLDELEQKKVLQIGRS